MKLTPVSLTLLFASLAAAQTANPLTEIVTQRFADLRLNLEQSAELMPADKYDFKLTPPQRSFGNWVGHTARNCYNYCSAIKGEKTPDAANHAEHLQTKPELTKALKESLAYCAAALQDMNDHKALVPAGPGNVAPVRGMVILVSAINSHYGNMVGYLRANNLVPPSTARAQKKEKASGAAPKH